VQTNIARNRPFGDPAWQEKQARQLGLTHTLRREGRPKAVTSDNNCVPVSSPQFRAVVYYDPPALGSIREIASR
jgi:hypothetical protein